MPKNSWAMWREINREVVLYLVEGFDQNPSQWVSQALKGFGFNLTNSFSGNVENFADFFQGVLPLMT